VLVRCHDLVAARSEPLHTLLAVGNPRPQDASVASLEYAAIEADQVAREFGDGATLLPGRRGYPARCDRTPPHEPRLALRVSRDFRTGGSPRVGPLMSHGERLTVGGLLDGGAVSEARLAVLSACETAISDFTDLPDELVGLPSAFLQAGVPGVIGTFWSVNRMSTALLMIRCYQLSAGRAGGSPARALREAQLWLRDLSGSDVASLLEGDARAMLARSGSDAASTRSRVRQVTGSPGTRPFEHPFYWAAFGFFGA
jgi:CHAT domain-containing protein